MNSRPVGCVAIIGVGLVGGSFGMALKKRGLAGRVIGVGRNPDRLQRAVELCAVDSWSTDLEAGVKGADLVYVSTPVGLELGFIRRAVGAAKDGCVITDAGSTKAEICAGADALVNGRAAFVGGHPMAGSETAGVESASADLFVNAAYVLTPTADTDSDALELMRNLASAVGARPILMDPRIHDRCAAVISHLPHLIAAALAILARDYSEREPQVLDLIAGSFRDMTRVAGSPPVLWRDICLTNPGPIHEAVGEFHQLLDDVLRAIKVGDGRSVEDWFEAAKQMREALFPSGTG